jgi:hypothetical protein
LLEGCSHNIARLICENSAAFRGSAKTPINACTARAIIASSRGTISAASRDGYVVGKGAVGHQKAFQRHECAARSVSTHAAASRFTLDKYVDAKIRECAYIPATAPSGHRNVRDEPAMNECHIAAAEHRSSAGAAAGSSISSGRVRGKFTNRSIAPGAGDCRVSDER